MQRDSSIHQRSNEKRNDLRRKEGITSSVFLVLILCFGTTPLDIDKKAAIIITRHAADFTLIIFRILLILLEQSPQLILLRLGPSLVRTIRLRLVIVLHFVALANRFPEEELCIDFRVLLGGRHKLPHHVDRQFSQFLCGFCRRRIQHLLEEAKQFGLNWTDRGRQKQQLIIRQLSCFSTPPRSSGLVWLCLITITIRSSSQQQNIVFLTRLLGIVLEAK